jgi:hypothetical protein
MVGRAHPVLANNPEYPVNPTTHRKFWYLKDPNLFPYKPDNPTNDAQHQTDDAATYIFKHREYNSGHYNTPGRIIESRMRAFCWNHDYSVGTSQRSSGGTVLQIAREGSTTFETMPDSKWITERNRWYLDWISAGAGTDENRYWGPGSYAYWHVDGEEPFNRENYLKASVFLYVKVKTSRDESKAFFYGSEVPNSWHVTVSAVSRTQGRAGWSWHSVHIRRNSQTEGRTPFIEGRYLE